MAANEEMEKLNKGFLTLNVLWAAILASLFIYMFVCLYIQDTIVIKMQINSIESLRNVLYILAIITIVTIRFIKNSVLYTKNIVVGLNTENLNNETVPSKVLAKYTSAMMISLAMAESVGIYGVVLFLLAKNTTDLYVFVLVAAAVMFFYRPKKDELLALIRQ